ncbi:MAG: FTR1 family protein, partial [Desulfurococcaceae archaeon TW002]
IEQRVEEVVTKGRIAGLISLSFIVVFRECLEIVLFLTPFMLSESVATLIGVLTGTLSALILSYGIFIVGMKISLQKFFYYTSLLLTLLAGGLAGYGVHELVEYYEYVGLELGWLARQAFDLRIPVEHPIRT